MLTKTLEEDWIKFLEEDHKISKDVWQKHKLSFDDFYLYFPYFSPSGTLLFTKKRKVPTYNGANKYLYPQGSFVTLYPHTDLSAHQEWILTEGELDELTLESYGILSAVTAGGVTGFNSKLASHFKNKKVFICFDNDPAGKNGTERVVKVLHKAGIETAIIDIPEELNGKHVKDIGDLFKAGCTREQFDELCSNARTPEFSEEKSSGTETPQSIEKQPLLTEQLTYDIVEGKVLALLPNAETGLKIILAIAVSSHFKNQVMLWLLIVGVPSSGKTELVRLVKEASITYYLDNLTQNAFISGERETESQKVYDLLPLLHGKCFIVKDWTSIFSLDEKMTKKLLGDLVGIYDKEFAKFSSRRGNVTYESAFSQLGCITPATLNKHTNYLNMVGPRYLCYSMPDMTEGEKEKSYDSIFSEADRSATEKEARLYTSSYLDQLTQKPLNIKPLSNDVKNYLRIAAEFMANCRGIVILQSASFKNESGELVNYYEILDIQIEEPWRAVQQLKALATYLAFVVSKEEVGVEELAIIKEIVMASMPADRAQALRTVKNHNGKITAKILSDVSEKSNKTARRLLDELVALRVLQKIKGGGSIATDYNLHYDFSDFILLDPAEFLSTYSSGTETPESIENTNNTEQHSGFNPKTKEFDEQIDPKQTSLDLKNADEAIPEELLAIDKNSNWAQYLPIKPIAKYTDGQLEQAFRMLIDYPEQMIKLLGSEETYSMLNEKLMEESDKRTIEKAEINF